MHACVSARVCCVRCAVVCCYSCSSDSRQGTGAGVSNNPDLRAHVCCKCLVAKLAVWTVWTVWAVWTVVLSRLCGRLRPACVRARVCICNMPQFRETSQHADVYIACASICTSFRFHVRGPAHWQIDVCNEPSVCVQGGESQPRGVAWALSGATCHDRKHLVKYTPLPCPHMRAPQASSLIGL